MLATGKACACADLAETMWSRVRSRSRSGQTVRESASLAFTCSTAPTDGSTFGSNLKTGIIWPRFDEPPRVAVRNLEIRGDEGNNVLIPLESGTWPDDIIDPRTGFSRRTYWLRIEGVSQNGKRLFWFGPVHIREAPGYSQPPGQFG